MLTKYKLLTAITLNSPVAASDSVSGKKVAKSSILVSWVKMYRPPAWMHFQKAPYSDLSWLE